ncbi:MAG: hypothetical protein COX17_05585 [Deltaproteobacteria bacterium CG23_combo_of_CG06-09_8_20_14_all_60_8]|nr:MAG: hypothetical protein COX17_05585 [Deltaproteobacteria bacterium CG23_combo_of_CG06-09_8_20_14_all_60_8]
MSMMLVPLELSALASRRGWLSPELAVGWRLARQAMDFFDGLEQVRIAATGSTDTINALRALARYPKQGSVVIPSRLMPWDVLFFHQITGTALKVVLIRKHIALPPELKRIENDLSHCSPELLRRYQEGLDARVHGIIRDDLERFSHITEIRCRVLAPDSSQQARCCPWCQAHNPSALLDQDGRICCPACSVLRSLWQTDAVIS